MMTVAASRHLPLLTQMFPGEILLNVEQIARCIKWSPGSIYNLVKSPKLPFKIERIGGRRCASILEVADYLDGMLTLSGVLPEPVLLPAPTLKRGPGRPRGSSTVRADVQIFQAELKAAICIQASTKAITEFISVVSLSKLESASSACESEFNLTKLILKTELVSVFMNLQNTFDHIQSPDNSPESDANADY